MAEQSLKDKTVKGTVWSGIDVFLSQGVTSIEKFSYRSRYMYGPRLYN